jgi:uncharacterized membrane protein YfcA
LFKGSKKNPSIFSIKTCSIADWTLLAIFVLLCVLLSVYALRKLQYEQFLKQTYGTGLVHSDIKVQGSDLFKLLICSFLGGWVSGAIGGGGSSIFNPILLSMGAPPSVASSTGMYMTIFSTGTSTLTYALSS